MARCDVIFIPWWMRKRTVWKYGWGWCECSPRSRRSFAQALVSKANKKELDDKKFSLEERKKWNEGDEKELVGAILVANRGTKGSEESSPMRYVRTAKQNGDTATEKPHHNPCTLEPTGWNVPDGRSNHKLGC